MSHIPAKAMHHAKPHEPTEASVPSSLPRLLLFGAAGAAMLAAFGLVRALRA